MGAQPDPRPLLCSGVEIAPGSLENVLNSEFNATAQCVLVWEVDRRVILGSSGGSIFSAAESTLIERMGRLAFFCTDRPRFSAQKADSYVAGVFDGQICMVARDGDGHI